MSWFIVAQLAAALSLSPVTPSVDSLSADQIIDRHIEAIGGIAKIRALRNLVYSDGLYEEGEYKGEGDAGMSLALPFYKLVGNQDDPGGYMEGYDGAAWEWFADPGIVIRTVGPASEAIRHYAGVESPLVDYRAKGSTVKVLGETALYDEPVVVIELTRRDGFVEQFYLDTDTWLISASGGAAPIHAFGDEVTTLTRISDYRPVAGVLIAHRFVSMTMPAGETSSSMQWGKIEANRDLPAGWFSPPEFRRTPLQAFIEHLYQQRSDVKAVMWTYHEFRRGHPQTDTSDPVNVAGFQMLKMDSVEQAITLLEQNARDHPDSANSRFGLGRAYRRAGRLVEARVEFRRALAADPEHERARAALGELGPE